MALKRMLITGKLKPTIVNMLQDSDLHSPHKALSASAGLGACARRFLDYECKTLNIREQKGESQPSAQVQSLALRLLENSVTLGQQLGSHGAGRSLPQIRHVDQFAERH